MQGKLLVFTLYVDTSAGTPRHVQTGKNDAERRKRGHYAERSDQDYWFANRIVSQALCERSGQREFFCFKAGPAYGWPPDFSDE